MAEADVQFGDGVRPVKTTQSRTFDVENDASLARQGANSDSEERALKITTDDLSRKHKQVCLHNHLIAAKLTLERRTQDGYL